MAKLGQGIPQIFGRRSGFKTSSSQDVFKDGTDNSLTLAGDDTDIGTYAIDRNILANSIYKTTNVVISFDYWYTVASATNTWGVFVDGVEQRSFTGVAGTQTSYSVWLKMSNTMNHTIVIRAKSVTIGRVVHCSNFTMTVTAELS